MSIGPARGWRRDDLHRYLEFQLQAGIAPFINRPITSTMKAELTQRIKALLLKELERYKFVPRALPAMELIICTGCFVDHTYLIPVREPDRPDYEVTRPTYEVSSVSVSDSGMGSIKVDYTLTEWQSSFLQR